LLAHVRELIDAARQRVVQAFDAEITLLYWKIGCRVSTKLGCWHRFDDIKQITIEVVHRLITDFSKRWSERQLHYCVGWCFACATWDRTNR